MGPAGGGSQTAGDDTGGGRVGGAGGGGGAARAIACATDVIDWVTFPSSPGLAMRIESARLQPVQLCGAAGALFAGGASGQSHCQFQIHPVAPPGGALGVGVSAQFHCQFQIQVVGV
ncbi:MAG TPA: hypothetical protein VFI04_02105 [Gaiellaceae bacterium]|nr:hypothetical protein [Gaiellaceae bacterium]